MPPQEEQWRVNSSAGVQSSSETAPRPEDPLTNKVAAGDEKESEEEWVMSAVEEEGELSDSSLLMDEALPNPLGKNEMYSVETTVYFLDETNGSRGTELSYFPTSNCSFILQE